MKKKLIEDLKNQDLPEIEKKYIVAVVEYIDSNMQKIEEDSVDFNTVINKMLDLVQHVNNCSTGIDYIDNIVNIRKAMAYEQIGNLGENVSEFIEGRDYRTGNKDYEFIQNYIATISNYGGLFKYVCETYQLELFREKTHSRKHSK